MKVVREILSDAEEKELQKHEAVIERGLPTFIEVGRALEAIRDEELYRRDYGTFDHYCRKRWRFGRKQGDRLIRSAVVGGFIAQELGEDLNERQCRALVNAPPGVQLDAVRNTGPERTAEDLQKEAERILGNLRDEINQDEAAARAARPSTELPGRDRLAAIKAKLTGAIKLVDGSIDYADRLEVAIRHALEVCESCSVV